MGKIVDCKYIPYDEIKNITALSFSNCDIKMQRTIEYFDKISKEVYEDLNFVFHINQTLCYSRRAYVINIKGESYRLKETKEWLGK